MTGTGDSKRSGRSAAVPVERLASLARNEAYLSLVALNAGYGKMEVLHQFNLQIARGQSLCLIGPNGAGKSTVLHSIFGLANIFSGMVSVDGVDITKKPAHQKLAHAKIGYLLQSSSIFSAMTVEENLWMGGYLMKSAARARNCADDILKKYTNLGRRRKHPASVLSGGERRLLEICRTLMMDPDIILLDEPTIGLEPRYIDMVFEILGELQHGEGKTLLIVEQNARRGLQFADIGYVLASGCLVITGEGNELLRDPEVEKTFLGG